MLYYYNELPEITGNNKTSGVQTFLTSMKDQRQTIKPQKSEMKPLASPRFHIFNNAIPLTIILMFRGCFVPAETNKAF
jgi:hypothetical protein